MKTTPQPSNEQVVLMVAALEALAEAMGLSKAQAAVYLIEHCPEPLSPLTRRTPAHEKRPAAD